MKHMSKLDARGDHVNIRCRRLFSNERIAQRSQSYVSWSYRFSRSSLLAITSLGSVRPCIASLLAVASVEDPLVLVPDRTRTRLTLGGRSP